MSKAFKCDRCSRFEELEPVAEVAFMLPVVGGDTKRREAMDLCTKCLANLRDFLDYYTNKNETEDVVL